MAGFDFAHLAIVCGFVSSALQVTRCSGWMHRQFAEDPQLRDKKMGGDGVITYNDVTAVTCAVRCMSRYPCGAYAYNAQERSCTLCALCGNFTLLEGSGYRLYVTISEESLESSDAQAGICINTTTDPEKCWKPSPTPMVHVSVGPGGVWAVDSQDLIYYRQGTYQNLRSFGTGWSSIYGKLVQLDVGSDVVWGVNRENRMFYKKDISSSVPTGKDWELVYFDKKWMSISPGGSRWARNVTDQLLVFTAFWHGMDMDVLRVDAGLAGVWVINTTGHVFHRLGTFGDSGSVGTGWQAVEGKFQSVASGRNVVVGVDGAGRVWLRTGLGDDTPAGLSWIRYPGNLTQVDVYQTDDGIALWGLNSGGQVVFSLFSG